MEDLSIVKMSFMRESLKIYREMDMEFMKMMSNRYLIKEIGLMISFSGKEYQFKKTTGNTKETLSKELNKEMEH